jgi:transglutaminase-like putative cysteine protease
MGWRIGITHTTGFEYEGEVIASYNRARLTPADGNGQVLLDHSVVVTPAAAVFSSTDYWGTRVHAFDLHVPHHRLEVVGRSLVETADARPIPASVTWGALADPDITDQFCEYLAPSPLTKPDDAIAALGVELRDHHEPVATVNAVVEWIRAHVTYERGVTGVQTPATGVLAARRGVCQDFAHLTIAILRPLGVPTRYVSGYLDPDATAEVGSTTHGESHAWVEVWTGAWWGLDPTSGEAVAERHVRVGHGRDYRDVAPLLGIFHGAPSKALTVSVALRRLA